MATDHIFIYGSLRREFSSPVRSVLEHHAEFIGVGTVPGKLYNIDWYPGALESEDPDECVTGAVYRVRNRNIVFSKLDQYEGCSAEQPRPHEFIRKKLPINLQSTGKLRAWIYLYNRSVSGKERIPSGDYAAYAGDQGM